MTASKSMTPSKAWLVRIHSLTCSRMVSPAAVKYPAPWYGRMVAPKILRPRACASAISRW